MSDALRAQAIARGYPAGRTLTHYLGVDLARFAAGGTPEPGLILHVGRLVEKKGTACCSTPSRECRRRGSSSSATGRCGRSAGGARALGLSDRVRFLGSLPPGEVADWMRRAWLLAVPSVTARDGDAEGLPTVIVEAAASGLPAVGTDHAGIPEAIGDGETGFIVPERDAPALASRIARPPRRCRAAGADGRGGAQAGGDAFDARRQIALLEDHYDRVRGARSDREQQEIVEAAGLLGLRIRRSARPGWSAATSRCWSQSSAR